MTGSLATIGGHVTQETENRLEGQSLQVNTGLDVPSTTVLVGRAEKPAGHVIASAARPPSYLSPISSMSLPSSIQRWAELRMSSRLKRISTRRF